MSSSLLRGRHKLSKRPLDSGDNYLDIHRRYEYVDIMCSIFARRNNNYSEWLSNEMRGR